MKLIVRAFAVTMVLVGFAVCFQSPAYAQNNGARMPPGGFTPVFNEITILLAFSPTRPAADATCEQIKGPCERILMQNLIDAKTGVVQPTIFIRSNPFVSSKSGVRSERLSLAADPALADSKLLGGTLHVAVKAPSNLAATLPPPASEELKTIIPSGAVIPTRLSQGSIKALSKDSDFPAKVSIPVYYSFTVETPGARGEDDPVSVRALEPHVMEAVVHTIPPDPETCVRSQSWTLVDGGTIAKLWIRVDCFRFLGRGDYEHKERLTYPRK